jgi:hypothetical protein
MEFQKLLETNYLTALNYIESIDESQVWLKTYLETLRFVFNAYFQFGIF